MPNNYSKEIEREINEYLNEIGKRCKQILEEEILNEIYLSYDPVQYNRTEQLLDGVRIKIEKDKLYVYIDEDLHYYSAVDGRAISGSHVAWWTNYGHHRKIENPIPNYDDYESKAYIELAAKRIRDELGVDVKIIKEKPPIV
jgi:hypothetical protein